jgi:homoserine kinase type II
VAQLTRLSVDAARTILEAWGLALERLDPLPHKGTINSNFRVRASGAEYFLRVNEGKRDEDVDGEARVVERLRAGGLPTPEVLRTRDGGWFARADGKPVTLFPWIAGREAEAAPDPALCGRALARLHVAGRALAADELPRNLYSLEALALRVQGFADDARVAAVAADLGDELGRARARLDAVPVPRGIIHQDLFPDNLLVDDAGGLAAVLDFEQATWGAWVYDLAVCVNAWCWDGARIVDEARRALVEAYHAGRALTAEERTSFADFARLAAARFTITRITDVCLRADVDEELRRRKDWRDYARRLDWWRSAA